MVYEHCQNPTGQGREYWRGRTKYIGQWKDNAYHGQGTKTSADGKKYIGQFEEGNYHGRGTLTWPDGRKYVGQFEDNRRNSYGTQVMTNGKRYAGQWSHDNLYDNNGKRVLTQICPATPAATPKLRKTTRDSRWL